MVISLLFFCLRLLTFGKGILMSSVAPLKGVRIPESGKFRNVESRIHRVKSKSKIVFLTRTLGQVQPSCCVRCHVLVLELKSCMLYVQVATQKCFQCCDYTTFKRYFGLTYVKPKLANEIWQPNFSGWALNPNSNSNSNSNAVNKTRSA